MSRTFASTTVRLLRAEQGDTTWMRQAECRRVHPDTRQRVYEEDLWFPASPHGPGKVQGEHAKAICRTSCPVVERCKEWALACLEFGIAGGLDEDQRRAERRAQVVSA